MTDKLHMYKDILIQCYITDVSPDNAVIVLQHAGYTITQDTVEEIYALIQEAIDQPTIH